MSRPELPGFLDEVGTAYALRDPETLSLVDGNRALEAVYDYSLSELADLHIEELSASTEDFSRASARRKIRTAVEQGETTFEWRIVRGDGERIWIEVHLSRLDLDGETYVLAEISDVTEYKERLRRLELLSRLVRHNLRNDVNVISGHAQRLCERIEHSELEDSASVIADIADNIGGYHEYIREIEQLATRDTGDADRDLAAMVHDVAEEFRESHPDARISVSVRSDVQMNVGPTFRFALKQAVENAIVHNDAPSPTVEIVLDRIEAEPCTQAVVRVVDDAPNIPASEIAAIEQGVEASSTTHGTGLGLWIMEWCTESLGGRLEFERRDPRGNVVEFTLPVEDVAEPE